MAAAGQVPAPSGFGATARKFMARVAVFRKEKTNLGASRRRKLPNCNSYVTMLKNLASAQKIACVWERIDQITGCPIRTCLWSCVGRRGSGQEASQPPSKDRQPEANRRTPPNGGRDLKQRRTGLFWSLSAPPKAGNRRGLSFLPGVRKGYLLSKRWL